MADTSPELGPVSGDGIDTQPTYTAPAAQDERLAFSLLTYLCACRRSLNSQGLFASLCPPGGGSLPYTTGIHRSAPARRGQS